MNKRAQQNHRQKPAARLLRGMLWALAAMAVVGLVAAGSVRWIDPPTSSILLQQNLFSGKAYSEWASFEWRPLEQISAQMALAVIAAEDQRFLQHHGLDFIELSKILREIANRPRGASTITQQVAKNLFLWGGRSYARKFLEAGLALYIDRVWGKRRVLEVYLNIVQFGPDTYGVEKAGRHFFDKRAAALNRYEAARLAAVLPNPNRRSANPAGAAVVKRQRWILRQMQALGGQSLLDGLR